MQTTLCKQEVLRGKEQAAISGRLILKGKLRLLSPLIIGGGSSLYGDSDIVVLKDEDNKPYIPSSSLTGALKHIFDDYEYTGNASNYEWNSLWFWGGEYCYQQDGEKIKAYCQSSMMISDLMMEENEEAVITVRDGIKINRKTGVVEAGKKFDFEVIEPGISFNFSLEVVIRNAFDKSVFDLLLQWVGHQLSNGKFALGARTGQGYGRCQLENMSYYQFDYSKRDHIVAWLRGDKTTAAQKLPDFKKLNNSFKYRYSLLKVKADFRIKNALIIGSYPGEPEAPDKVHIKSQDAIENGKKAVIPGTSFRGAIRARAEKIYNTLGGNGEEELKSLFGWVEDNPQSETDEQTIKGKITIEEKPITPGSYKEEIQHRIKIDRFTGGVINNALFDSMPIWSKENHEPMVRLELSIKAYEPWEAGLILLVLKDLWNGDLALGGEKNVGRGVLQGQKASISLADGTTIIMQQQDEKLQLYKEGDKANWDNDVADRLEELLTALLQKIATQAEKVNSEVNENAE